MKSLAREKLVPLLAEWATEYDVIAPLKSEQGDIVVGAFDEGAFTLDYGKPALSAKSACLPQSEITFTVREGNYRGVIPETKTLLFGIRPCDMMGMLQTTSFMTRDQEDFYYRTRRDGTLIAVMACPGPQNETCFCTTVSSGPWAERGYDLQFYDLGDSFLVEAGSEAGERLLGVTAFTGVDETEARRRIASFREAAEERIAEVPDVTRAMETMGEGMVDSEIWDYFGDKCLACGGCAFVCPTCTCFNVYDQVTEPGGGLRLRAWDACLYGGLTREASGHNPRPTQASRIRRRYEHKFLWFNKADTQGGLSGCVGCGRCSDYCPVHIGALEVTRAIAAGSWPGRTEATVRR